MQKAIIILLAFLSAVPGISQQDKRLKGIEKDLDAILEVTKAAGFAVAVVEGKNVIYAAGFGYRDFENKVPADANTLFAIGSSSKAFTCGLLGQLRNEEKLSFDDSPIKYVPELRFYNDELNNGVIIKDLMTHRTGIPRHDYSWYMFPTYDKDSLVSRIQYLEPFTGLREQYYYNNFMFLLQGVIAERITGKSWEDNMRERFFGPLGMTRSNLSIDEMETSDNAAFGYELKNDSIINKIDYYHIAAMAPAGSINSSVNDMSHWLVTWINKGKFNGQEILPEPYVMEAMSSHMVINAGLPDEEFPDIYMANYGYGWSISSFRGHYRVEHGGNINGFSASVAFFPSDSLGIVVLANQSASAVPGLVRNTIAERMLNTERTDWAERFIERKEKAKKENEKARAEKASPKTENTRPSHVLVEYEGEYSNPGYGKFSILGRNDSLFAHLPLKKYYLKHVHYDIFELQEVTKEGIDTTDTEPLQFNFSTGNSGEISALHLKIEPALDHPIEFRHIPRTIDVDMATLEKYVGEYQVAGMVIKVYVKNERTLYLFVPGQPEYELLATDKHKFSFKSLEGFKVEFIESDDGSVNELALIQPNGTFKASRK